MSTCAKLAIQRDKGGIPTFSRKFSEESYNILMDASTDYTLTVPPCATIAIFNSSSDFWVSDSLITLPTGAFNKEEALLSPSSLNVLNLQTLYFKTMTASTQLSISFYTSCSVFEG